MLRSHNNLRGALAVLALPLHLDLKLVISRLKIFWKGEGDTGVSASLYGLASIDF
jgi:hypothetical protein